MPPQRVIPDFFIVGAFKCGTTSLYHYLRQHPEVFMPRRKEPHFFSTDMYRPLRISEPEYFALFSPGIGKRRVGEASTEYLYSQAACRQIRAVAPDALIIIMLRNPVDMIYSAHSTRVSTGREEILDFESALDAEEDRRRGRRLPRFPYPVATLFYSEMGLYSEYVRRYLETFGERQVHVVIFDDLVADPTGVYRQVCTFLNIDPNFVPDVAVLNRNKVPRLAELAVLANAMKPVRMFSRTFFPPGLRMLGARAVKFLVRMNTRTASRPPMNPELRKKLQDWFAADVGRLGVILGRDLSHWVRDER